MDITAQQIKLNEYVALEAQVVARKATVSTEAKRSEFERLHRLIQLTIGGLKDTIKKALSGEQAEELLIRLFVAKQELGALLDGSADARKSAQADHTEFPSSIYRSLAADLDALVALKRAEIVRLESQLSEAL